MSTLKDSPDEREQTILKLGKDPRLAHAVIFAHRHPLATPDFHGPIIDAFHSRDERATIMAFRGGAKSTIAEEAVTLLALFQRFRNALLIAESERRAMDRLASIKNELESNDFIEELFGNQVGPTWQATKLVLQNGCCIQAIGRGQSLRGTKHLDYRPDFAFVDDLEDEESVRSPANRDATMTWFLASLVPAMKPGSPIRVAATPLDPDAFAVRLMSFSGWRKLKFPIEHINPVTGERTPTWPANFPLEKIDMLKREFAQAGKADIYQREYMCEAVDPSTRVFTSDMIKVAPAARRTWHAVYAMYDPARTTASTSATTGKAVWSWIGNKLVIWETAAKRWMPDEIIKDIFAVDDKYAPVKIGVERDGLEEFLLQPIRQEAARQGRLLPLSPQRAPRGKIDFIKGLQPWFKAGEIEFAGERADHEAAIGQFLSFPTGDIDAPNALAYALLMRPGLPVYNNFNAANIMETVPRYRNPYWLALNATNQETTAVLCQMREGALFIHADWVNEGDPGRTLLHILQEAALYCQLRPNQINITAGPKHFAGFDTVGLLPASRKVPVQLRRGGDELSGREELRKLLTLTAGGIPMLQVGEGATWTLRALAGGYARKLGPDGRPLDVAEDNAYATLMQGLESFTSLLRIGAVEENKDVRYDTASDGRRFISARV